MLWLLWVASVIVLMHTQSDFFSQGPEESLDTPGVADINREYRDSQNPNMQAGKTRNIQILKDFGRCREARRALIPATKIHVVWWVFSMD